MNQMAFDWNEASDAVVQPTMWATAVYLSEVGNVVIRQEPAFGHTEDHVIILAPPYAIEVANRILAMFRPPDSALERFVQSEEGRTLMGPAREQALIAHMKRCRPDIDWQKAVDDFNRIPVDTDEEATAA